MQMKNIITIACLIFLNTISGMDERLAWATLGDTAHPSLTPEQSHTSFFAVFSKEIVDHTGSSLVEALSQAQHENTVLKSFKFALQATSDYSLHIRVAYNQDPSNNAKFNLLSNYWFEIKKLIEVIKNKTLKRALCKMVSTEIETIQSKANGLDHHSHYDMNKFINQTFTELLD